MSNTQEELYQCPCSPACKCIMEDPCHGCETYGEWLNSRPTNGLEEALEEIERYTHDSMRPNTLHINAIATTALAAHKERKG